MTPEQINKLNENPGEKRGLDFIDLIQKDGYVIANYTKVAEIAEAISRGAEEPLRKYYSIKNLENNMSNMEELTTNFRFGMRDLLNEVSTIVKNDGKFADPDNRFDVMLNDIKTKLGIVQATNRVAEAEASRAKTRAAIAALDSNTSMTQEAKNAEFRRLFAIYTGPNVKAIENAKKIANRQDNNFNMNLDNNFLDKIGYDLKNVYDYLMTTNLSSEVKKTLIDKFNNIVAVRNEYKARLNKYMSNLNLYKNTLTSLGLSWNAKKSEKKEVKPEEPIKEEQLEAPIKEEPTAPIPPTDPVDDTPKIIDEYIIYKGPKNLSAGEFASYSGVGNLEINQEYKITNLVIKDGLTYYQLEGHGDRLYSGSLFEPKNKTIDSADPENKTINPAESENDVQQLDDKVKPPRGKKVTAFKKAMGKLAKPARLAAVLFLTGAVLLPALGSPLGLIAGAMIAVGWEKIVAKKQGLKPDKERRSVKERLTELKDELTKKVSLSSTAPDEKNELDDFISEIESNLKESFDKEKEAESVIEDEVDQEVRIAREIMAEEGLTPEEAADKAIEMQAEVPADDEPSLTR